MNARELRANEVTYNAAISAISSRGRWDLAVVLFEEMLQSQLCPGLMTQNAFLTVAWQIEATWTGRLCTYPCPRAVSKLSHQFGICALLDDRVDA
eukprot:Skav229167  [mRNA]  locus=scaffold1381:305198:306449:+ [translate_table: standard]